MFSSFKTRPTAEQAAVFALSLFWKLPTADAQAAAHSHSDSHTNEQIALGVIFTAGFVIACCCYRRYRNGCHRQEAPERDVDEEDPQQTLTTRTV